MPPVRVRWPPRISALALCVLLLNLCTLIQASEDGFVTRPRCDLSLHEEVARAGALAATQKQKKTPSPTIVYPSVVLENSTMVWIPVVFHIIIGKMAKNPGFVPRDVLVRQIEVMNEAYSGAQAGDEAADVGLRFLLSGVNYYRSQAWFRTCQAHEFKLKSKTSLDREGVLNVWTCDLKETGLGFAPFPVPGGAPQRWDQGVVLDHRALPRVRSAPNYKPVNAFDLGDSLVHEVGHFLGLYHTFQNGCNAPGDHIDDTAPERVPYYGYCEGATSRDSCPEDSLPDPIRNFMDYSTDSCMNHFTPLQIQKMRRILGEMRSNMARMAWGMRCTVKGGKPGTALPLSSCREAKCRHTRMPNGRMPPPSGWCHGVGLSGPGLRRRRSVKSWGVCCCPNDPACPALSKPGFSNFVSRSTNKVPKGRLLEEEQEGEEEEEEQEEEEEEEEMPLVDADPSLETVCSGDSVLEASYALAARTCAASGLRLCRTEELKQKSKDLPSSSCAATESYWTMSFCEGETPRARVFAPATRTTACRPVARPARVTCCPSEE